MFGVLQTEDTSAAQFNHFFRDRQYSGDGCIVGFLHLLPQTLKIQLGQGLVHHQQQLLQFEAGRAQEYYRSGQKLMPLIDADSRPALWVLITIYHRLLRRIERSGYNVFSGRVSVPTYEKLAILGWGIFRTMGARGSFRG